MDINYALKLFKESESDIAVQLRKAEQAKTISKVLRKLKIQAAKLVTKIECEVAVVEAQNIIDQ
jgi:hypothetical protein